MNEFIYWISFLNTIHLTGHVKIVKTLIENGADIDAESVNKTTPLHMAAIFGIVV